MFSYPIIINISTWLKLPTQSVLADLNQLDQFRKNVNWYNHRVAGTSFDRELEKAKNAFIPFFSYFMVFTIKLFLTQQNLLITIVRACSTDRNLNPSYIFPIFAQAWSLEGDR